MNNLTACVPLFDAICASSSFLKFVWQKKSEELMRLGFKTLFSNDGFFLSSIKSDIKKILVPGFMQNELSYAEFGVVPVLDDAAHCYFLSDLAQILNKHLPFVLRFRSSAASGIPDMGAESILSKLSSISMIDLDGLYIDFLPDIQDLQYLRTILFESGFSADLPIYLSGELGICGLNQVKAYTELEAAGFGSSEKGVFPIEISVTAYPIKFLENKAICRAWAGHLDGLPERFPIAVSGCKAELMDVSTHYFDFQINDLPECVGSVKTYLIGGEINDFVDYTEWDRNCLKSLILHNYPVYEA